MGRLVNAKPSISVEKLKKDFKVHKQRKKNLQMIAPDQLISTNIKKLNSIGKPQHNNLRSKNTQS